MINGCLSPHGPELVFYFCFELGCAVPFDLMMKFGKMGANIDSAVLNKCNINDQLLLDTAPDVVFVVYGEGRAVDCSQNITATFGFQSAENILAPSCSSEITIKRSHLRKQIQIEVIDNGPRIDDNE